jgi:hypothetical protein
LEGAGFSVWTYERDSIPGLSYLRQTHQAIRDARILLLVISADAILSHQIDKEVVRAHEDNLPILPVLCNISFAEFRRARPEWHQAIGAAVALQIPPAGFVVALPRLIAGVKALLGDSFTATPEKPARSGSSDAQCTIEPVADNEGIDETPQPAREQTGEHAAGPESENTEHLVAQFVHEHPATGFLADLLVPATNQWPGTEPSEVVAVFIHKLLGSMPLKVAIRLSANRQDPVQYLRLAKLVHGYPVILRVHWVERMLRCPALTASAGRDCAPSVQVAASHEQITTRNAAGLVLGGSFTSVIPEGTFLPCVVKKRMRTRRDNQSAISVTPSVMTSTGELLQFPKLSVPVVPAPAKMSWIECTFRVDPDGRYTVWVRDPLRGMRIEDMIGPGHVLRAAT